MALGKKLRNRVIGVLVLVSLAMILIPAVMDPGQVYKRSADSIAVNSSGAVTDDSGRMLNGSAQDYSDLLAPIEDNGVTPEQLAAQNSGKSSDTRTQSADLAQVPASSGSLDLLVPPESAEQAIPQEPEAQVQKLKQAQGISSESTAMTFAGNSSAGAETLVSSRAQPSQSTRQMPQSTANKSSGSETLVSKRQSSTVAPAATASGSYTVQAGVFSQQANADKVIQKLKASGISARAVNAVINGKNLIRVYAGSAKTRQAAEGIAKRVQQVIGTKPSIVQL